MRGSRRIPGRVLLTLVPKQPGTLREYREYGRDLLAVRYRYDKRARHRVKTVELVIESIPWRPH
jgi:hypothetical protein